MNPKKNKAKAAVLFAVSVMIIAFLFTTPIAYAKVNELHVCDAPTGSISITTHSEQSEKILLPEAIYSLNDQEFDDFFMEYMYKAEMSGKCFEQIQSELSSFGIEVGTSSIQRVDSYDTRYIAPSSVTIKSYTAKRIGDSYYRIFGQVIHNSTEWSPGSLDLLSVEWDYTKATHYSTTTDGEFTTYMDGSKKDKGICLFNVEDDRMYAGDYAYAVVYIIPKSSGLTVDIGTKYIHTYNQTNITWAIGVNVGYTSTGPTGGFTFNITGTNVVNCWQLYAENAFSN